MAAKRIPGTQCRLEVHWRTTPELPQGRERERFAGNIGGERRRRQLGDGEAAALHANAVPDASSRQVESLTGNHQAQIPADQLAGLYPSDVLNDSRKQACALIDSGSCSVLCDNPRHWAKI